MTVDGRPKRAAVAELRREAGLHHGARADWSLPRGGQLRGLAAPASRRSRSYSCSQRCRVLAERRHTDGWWVCRAARNVSTLASSTGATCPRPSAAIRASTAARPLTISATTTKGMTAPTSAQQLLRAGRVDEIRVHVVPVLFGAGTACLRRRRGHIRLEMTGVVEGDTATHLTYTVRRDALVVSRSGRCRSSRGCPRDRARCSRAPCRP
jgi:hypothetical protein